jgi:hypothetical protein
VKIRAVVIVPILIIATIFYHSIIAPFPYNLYTALLVASYPLFMETSLYALPIKGVARLITVWLAAIAFPPVWAAFGIILLFPEPQKIFASSDVLLPFLWILITIVFYTYSVILVILETIRARR